MTNIEAEEFKCLSCDTVQQDENDIFSCLDCNTTICSNCAVDDEYCYTCDSLSR